MLVSLFATEVFDAQAPPDLLDRACKEGDLDINIFINHQAHKFNVLFCRMWCNIFKTWPSSRHYQEFLTEMEINPFNESTPIKVDSALIEKFLNRLLILKLGHMTRVNLVEFGKYANDVVAKLTDSKFILTSLVEKWQWRFDTQEIHEDSLIHDFVKAVQERPQWLHDAPSITQNPLTEFIVRLPSTIESFNHHHQTIYLLHEDLYFVTSLMHHPVIVIEKPVLTQAQLDQAIHHIAHHFNQKCIIFAVRGQYNEVPHGRLYNCIPETMRLIPKVAPWCLMIGSNTGLAYHEKDNICYLPSSDTHTSMSTIAKDAFYNTTAFWKVWGAPQHKYFEPQSAFIDFVYRYSLKHEVEISYALQAFLQSKTNVTPYAIILVDNRANELSAFACKFAMKNVADPNMWKCIIITTEKQREYYNKELGGAVDIWTHPLLDEVGFDLNTYNDILQDEGVWQKLVDYGIKKVLVVQDDGMLLRPGVEDFLSYDYVGAPWADAPENQSIKDAFGGRNYLVGNGGFSVRSVDAMLRICKAHKHDKYHTFYHNINRIPEDVWFVEHLLEDNTSKLPTVEQASYFSVEQVLNSKSIGFHKFWLYHPMSVVQEIFRGYLSD